MGGVAVVAVLDPVEQDYERLAEKLYVASRRHNSVENGLEVSMIIIAVPEDLEQALP